MLGALASVGLPLLYKGVRSLGNAAVDALADKAEKETGIDIRDENQVRNASPEQLAKLKEFEHRNRKMLIEAALERDRMRHQNVADARDLQKTALKQSDKTSKRFIYWYAGGITLVAMVYCFVVSFMEVPRDNTQYVSTILGFLLGTAIGAIINFFFGSSSSSSDKQGFIEDTQRELMGVKATDTQLNKLMEEYADGNPHN